MPAQIRHTVKQDMQDKSEDIERHLQDACASMCMDQRKKEKKTFLKRDQLRCYKTFFIRKCTDVRKNAYMYAKITLCACRNNRIPRDYKP